MSERGVRLGNELLEFIPGEAKVWMMEDRLLVEPLPHEQTLLIAGWKPTRGRVVAAGKGIYPIKYDGPKGRRTKSWRSKHFRPCDVKVGDIVELGGRELGGYLHPTVRWGDKEVVLCREEDVAIVRE